MKYFDAAVLVLSHAPRPVSIAELTAVALAHNLIRPRGRTPDRSMSSVLYRRMAADPDAPVACDRGRFRLRDQPASQPAGNLLQPSIRDVRRHAAGPRVAQSHVSPLRSTTLPPPPFTLPASAVPSAPPSARVGKRERAIARIDDGLATLDAGRTSGALGDGREQDVAHYIASVLKLLGYRRADRLPCPSTHGRIAFIVQSGNVPQFLIECVPSTHDLADSQARPAQARAREHSVTWFVLTNGLDLRLYHIGGPLSAGALPVVRIPLTAWSSDDERRQSAGLLYMLRKDAAVQSLDAYLIARAAGSALLSACDDPTSALLRSLGDAINGATGLAVPAATLARQLRIALRNARGRNGEPLPADATQLPLASRLPDGAAPGILIPFDRAG
jgi:hypothetical protein